MTVQLKKVDGGYEVFIPDELAAQNGLSDGATVTVTPNPSPGPAERPPAKRYTLAELLAGITPENMHGEVDWGPPVGKERFWE